MGAFNELILKENERVQFKFGIRWQYEYRLGDTITFSERQVGRTGQFEVPGIGGYDSARRYYVITFIDGVITNAREVDESEWDALDRVVDF